MRVPHRAVPQHHVPHCAVRPTWTFSTPSLLSASRYTSSLSNLLCDATMQGYVIHIIISDPQTGILTPAEVAERKQRT